MKLFYFLILMIFSVSTVAAPFTCHVELKKAACWNDFDVTFEMINTKDNSSVKTITLPKGTLSQTLDIDCDAVPAFTFTATYSPAVWENRKGEIYRSGLVFEIPKTLAKGDTSWISTLCFAADFNAVPLPLNANNNTECK